MRARLIFLLIGCIVLGGCSSVRLLNWTIPNSGYTLYKDVSYAEGPRHQLDIYVPKNMQGDAPVVLFFYGGSWQYGSKEDFLFVGEALASKGFVTVIADYRLYPQIYYPDFVADGADALHWVHDHIGAYHGDADNLFLTGHSAGAYIAMMLTANEALLKARGVDPKWIRGSLGLAGPYDFLPFTDADIKAIFSHARDAETQPIYYMTHPLPPVFLATGDEDTTVDPRNSFHVAERLKQLGSPVEVKTYPGVAHVGIILSLANGFRFKSPALEDMAQFIRAHRR